MNQANVVKQERSVVGQLTINAMFIALTLVFTAFLNIRLPIAGNGGLIHLGNIPLFIGAVIYGKKTGMIAGAFGMALFDIMSGWVIWAPFTFIIMGIIGFLIGKITESNKGFLNCSFAFLIAAILKVVGYYFTEVILYKNYITPLGSIAGNLIQIGVSAAIVLAVIGTLQRVLKKEVTND